RGVLVDEIRHHLLVELPLKIEDIVRDVERGGHAPRVVQVVERAATAERAVTVRLPGNVVELHRHTDDLVALLGKERRRHRRVDPAGHCYDDSHRVMCHENTKSRKSRYLTKTPF